MKIKILNPWTSSNRELNYYYYSTEDMVYSIADYAIYREGDDKYIYAYKNLAINCLAGINKNHLNNLAMSLRPTDSVGMFLYDRAQENKKKGLALCNI